MAAKVVTSASAGAVFGAALTASGVYLPSVIIKQMQLQDFHMLQVFLTATATSALVTLALEKLEISPRIVRSSSSFNWLGRYDANVIGGALIGIGMALSGACPGTVIAQLATGVKSSLSVALGGVLGGIFFAKFGKAFKKTTSAHTAQPEAHTIASKFQLDANMTFLAFEVICVAVVGLATAVASEKPHAWVHPIAGGLLIGGAQAASIVLTSSMLGVSSAYEQVGQYFWRALGQKDVPASSSPPADIIFALGLLGGSAAVARSLPPKMEDAFEVSKFSALAGGFLMILGARSAGGCTSGHGISGLSTFSFSSLITVAAMFGGGIATAMLLR